MSPRKPTSKPQPSASRSGRGQGALPIVNVPATPTSRSPQSPPPPPIMPSSNPGAVGPDVEMADEDDGLLIAVSQMVERSGSNPMPTPPNDDPYPAGAGDDFVPPPLVQSPTCFQENVDVQTTLWKILQNEESQSSQNASANSDDAVQQNKSLRSQLEKKNQELYAAQGEISTLRHVLTKRNTGAAQTAAAKTTLLTQKDLRIKAQDSEILKLQKELEALKVDLQFKANQITTQSIQIKQIKRVSTSGSQSIQPSTPRRPSPRRTGSQFPTRKSFMGKEIQPLVEMRDVEIQTKTIIETKAIPFLTSEDILQNAYEFPKLSLKFEASVFLRFLKDRLEDSTLIKNEAYFDSTECRIGMSRNEADIMLNLFNWISMKEESGKIAALDLPRRIATIHLNEAQASLSTEDMFRSGIDAMGAGRVDEMLFFLKQELLAILRTKAASNGTFLMWNLEHIKVFLTLLTLSEHFWNVVPFQEMDLKENGKTDKFYRTRHDQLLGDWTELITRVPYVVITSGKYQLENRLRTLRILLAIIKTGYFRHTTPNYHRLQILLVSSCNSEIYRRTEVIYYVLDVITALSRYTAILSILCHSTSNKKGACLVDLIGQRVCEIFVCYEDEMCYPMGLPLYQKYLSFLELLDDPGCSSCQDFDQTAPQISKTGDGRSLEKTFTHDKITRSSKPSQSEQVQPYSRPAKITRPKRRRISNSSDSSDCAEHGIKKPCEDVDSDSDTQFEGDMGIIHLQMENSGVSEEVEGYSEENVKRILAPEWVWDGKKEVTLKMDAHCFVPNLISWLDPSTWADQKFKKTLCQCRKSLIINLQKIQLIVSERWRRIHFRSELSKAMEAVSQSQWKTYKPYFAKNTQAIHKRMAELSKDENLDQEEVDKKYGHLTKLLTNGVLPSDPVKMELTNVHTDDEIYYSQMAASRGTTLLNNIATQTELGAFSFGTQGSQMYHLLAGFNYAYSDEGLPLNEVQSELTDAMVDNIDESFEHGSPPDPTGWKDTLAEFPWLGGGIVPDLASCPPIAESFYLDSQRSGR